MKSIESKTIAVLPFVNMSSSEENEYFSDGITEEIINALAKIGQLKVTSRTSSFFFKNKNIPVQEIGNTLGVNSILEGSVRLSASMVRITAQLINCTEDCHIWSETWNRKLENIFEVQDEISLIIADKMREQFGHFDIQEHLVEKQTYNMDAYAYSLKAKYLRNKWNPDDVKTAITLYQKALALDANHGESLVGLADCYSFLGTTAFMPFEESWKKTITYTHQALAVNSRSSGVHYQLSNQAFFVECNYSKSLKEMKRAIELNPNNAEALQFMSFLYILAGKKKAADKHLRLAASLNPLSEETQFFRAYYHYMTGDFSKSLLMLDSCLSANDKNIPAHAIKTLCLLALGKYDEVLNYFGNIPPEVVIEGEKTGSIALAFALKKDRENALLYLNKLKTMAGGDNGFTANSYLFMMHVVMGNFDLAFEWVETALLNKSSLLLLRYTDPLVHPLKSDARYPKFMQLMYQSNSENKGMNKSSELLDAHTSEKYTQLLLAFLSEEKPYLNPDLSLRTLAQHLNMHPNHLSWLLNKSLGKNFNEFINQYRIEAFKRLAKDAKHASLTIEGMAYECGFNSKTVFNTSFKKETGLTPRQFMAQ